MKRLAIWGLLLGLLLMLPGMAGAATGSFKIDGQNGLDLASPHSEPGRWSWDNQSNTLTLEDGYNSNDKDITFMCDESDTIHLVFKGDATITTNNYTVTALYSKGSLTINGTGTLTLEQSNESQAIMAAVDLTISSGTIEATSQHMQALWAGYGVLTIEGDAEVTATTSGSNVSALVSTQGTVINTSRSVTATSNCTIQPTVFGGLRLLSGRVTLRNLGDPNKLHDGLTHLGGTLNGSKPPSSAGVPTSYTVSATADPAKGGSVTGDGNYTSGSTATLTAKPGKGWGFMGWTVDGAAAGAANPLTFTVERPASVIAHFEAVYTGEENTYPDPVNGSQAAPIRDGVAVVSLMRDNALKITRQVKGKPGIRVARLQADTGSAKAVLLRLSGEGLGVLKSANIDALEICSAALDIYLDKQMLQGIASAASPKGTYRLLVTSGENSVTVQGDLGEGKPQPKGKGLLTIRLPLAKAASVGNGYYQSPSKTLVFAPKSYGSFPLANRAENPHWAADYMAFAEISGKPDDAYTDKDGKSYTRDQFATKLHGELAAKQRVPAAMRAAYPFKDSESAAPAASREAIILLQAGVAAPLSDGTFGGEQALTNAQAAAWLARLDWLSMDPLSPYGWALSDDGVRMYYGYTGNAVTGKAMLGGKEYIFDNGGFLVE